MPQTIYLPEKKNWWDPVMKQGTNFLWQLAMVKARHKIKMEETDRLLAFKKIEAEKERAHEQAKLKEGREYAEKQATIKERGRLAAAGQKVTPAPTAEEQTALSITGAPAMEPPKGQMYSPLAKGYVSPKTEQGKRGLQRKTRLYVENDKLMKQEYNFDPQSGVSTDVGKPFEARRGGSSISSKQLKRKVFVGKDGKPYAQWYIFNPKTKSMELYGEPWQVPDSFNILEFLMTGKPTGGTAQESGGGTQQLLEEIEQINQAIESLSQ